MQLSSTADTLYEAMIETGTLLPRYMVTDNNRDAQQRRLSLVAGLAGMARATIKDLALDGVTPEILYIALDAGFSLEKSGIYDFKETLALLEEVYERTVSPPYPPLLVPSEAYPDGEPLEVFYGIDLAKFSGKLSGRKRTAWRELMEDLQTLGRERYPWRLGTDRAEHSEPFVVGKAPEEPTL